MNPIVSDYSNYRRPPYRQKREDEFHGYEEVHALNLEHEEGLSDIETVISVDDYESNRMNEFDFTEPNGNNIHFVEM